jgi:hypothetical protein
MTGNLKKLGLALVGVLVLGAVGAQGASAVTHTFHSDGPKTIVTGTNVGPYQFGVGAAGIEECKKVTAQGTETGTEVSAGTFANNTENKVTIVPKYEECTFGGQAATVNFHHCAFVFYGETTTGNTTIAGKEHANVEIECSGPEGKITTHTVNCTITIGPQLIKHAVRYENELGVPSATRIIWTAHGIVVGKERTTASQPVNGCIPFPTGAIGKLTGTTTNKCFRDDNVSHPAGTETTTPPAPTEGPTTNCTVSGAPTV